MILAFMADLARLHGCKLRLATGLATNRDGSNLGMSACGACQGCNQAIGDLGLTSHGQRIVGSQAGIYLEWDCPGCGRETTQDTAWNRTEIDAADVAADGLCYRCRRDVPSHCHSEKK